MIPNFILNSISDINNKYPNINYGGCGTFSYYLHKSLMDNHGIKSEIVYLKSEYPPGGRPDYDIRFKHILLKVDNVLIDNNGTYNYNDHKKDLLDLTVSKLEEMINIPELWNNIFNHTDSENLKKDLKQI